MQKIKMSRGTLLTFEEGCNKYLENCRQRNLREGTINHYNELAPFDILHVKLHYIHMKVRNFSFLNQRRSVLSLPSSVSRQSTS